MAKQKLKPACICLKEETIEALDKIAQDQNVSRNMVATYMIEKGLGIKNLMDIDVKKK